MIITSSLLLLAAQSAFTVTNSSYSGPVERPAHARLVWSDEFNGSKLDTAKWHCDTFLNKKGWFNKELQYYSANRAENLRVANGVLTISARHETLDPGKFTDWGGQKYTSAKIYSIGTGWTYGFYEMRAKLPCARGTWPAIWMLPVDMKKWPDDGEIDIMEQVGAEPNLTDPSHPALQSCAEDPAERAEVGADQLQRIPRLPARLAAGFNRHRC